MQSEDGFEKCMQIAQPALDILTSTQVSSYTAYCITASYQTVAQHRFCVLTTRLKCCQSYSTSKKPAFELDPEAFGGSLGGEQSQGLAEQAQEAGDLLLSGEYADQAKEEDLANLLRKPPTSHESPSLLYDPMAK